MTKVGGKLVVGGKNNNSKKLSRKQKKRAKKLLIKRSNKIQKSNERIIKAQYEEYEEKEKEEDKIYRYSIAYSFYGNGYGKTFRAEVYTKQKVSETQIHTKLEYFLRAKIANQNKGLQVMFNRATYEGLESEEVGKNDVGNSQLNRMFFYMD
jgi:hypothetical protein